MSSRRRMTRDVRFDALPPAVHNRRVRQRKAMRRIGRSMRSVRTAFRRLGGAMVQATVAAKLWEWEKAMDGLGFQPAPTRSLSARELAEVRRFGMDVPE